MAEAVAGGGGGGRGGATVENTCQVNRYRWTIRKRLWFIHAATSDSSLDPSRRVIERIFDYSQGTTRPKDVIESEVPRPIQSQGPAEAESSARLGSV